MVDTFVATVTFWTLGYGQCYGSAGGLLGSGSFFDIGFTDEDYTKWVISLCFCTTTCTIISGALADGHS